MSALQGFFIGITLLFGSLYVSTLNFLHIQQDIPVTHVATSTNEKQIVQPVSQTSISTAQALATSSVWVSFSSIQSDYYQKNGQVFVKTVSVGDQEVPDADPQSFQVAVDSQGEVVFMYAKDKSHVYYRTKIDQTLLPIAGADPGTFTINFGNPDVTAEDKNHKYYFGGVVCEDPTKTACTQAVYGPELGHWYQNQP